MGQSEAELHLQFHQNSSTVQLSLLISGIGSQGCQTQAADRYSEFVNNESRPLGTQANEVHVTGKI